MLLQKENFQPRLLCMLTPEIVQQKFLIVDTQERERRVRTPINEETMLDLAQNNTVASTRAIASHLSIQYSGEGDLHHGKES
ncbi:hypothetical protein TNCV_3938021 [Trichonephila clavipes]|nr:hypothetical protein TNCV_3938021 [Trichonephila clavipes]